MNRLDAKPTTVGVPTSMMVSVTNINGAVMTRTIGSDMSILALVVPFLVLVVISGFKRAIEIWPAAIVVGFSYAATCFEVSHHLGDELPASRQLARRAQAAAEEA